MSNIELTATSPLNRKKVDSKELLSLEPTPVKRETSSLPLGYQAASQVAETPGCASKSVSILQSSNEVGSISLSTQAPALNVAQLIFTPSNLSSIEPAHVLAELQRQAALQTSNSSLYFLGLNPSGCTNLVEHSIPETIAHNSNSKSSSRARMAPGTSAVKREHEDDDVTDDSDDSGDDYDSLGRGRPVDYSVTSPGYSSTDSGGASNHAGGPSFSVAGSSRRATGPRKSRNSVPLTAEEEERRRMRRERNKHAAAKCRQKRVDLTNSLLEETQCLESEQQRLQDEIKSYQQEKEELEFILEAHRLHCGVDIGLNPVTAAPAAVPAHHSTLTPAYALPVVKVEGATEPVILQISQTATGPKFEALQSMSAQQVISSASLSSLASSNLINVIQPAHPAPGASNDSMEDCVTTVISTADGTKVQLMHKRPSSLGTKSVWSTRSGAGVDSINMFTIGLESMMDGHTGLTPITGMPAAVQLLATPSGPLPVTSISNMSDGQLSIPENLSSRSGNSPASTRSMVTL